MSSVVISGDTSGAITLSAPAVSGTNTATLPAATGTVMVSGNQPAFSAYIDTSTSVPTATYTKILYGTENFDTNNNFASSRFTPTVAGYYQITGNLRFGSITASIVIASIYKNGSLYYLSGCGVVSGYSSPTVSSVIYLNGSTDYVEIYAYQNSGTTQSADNGTYYIFSGCLLRTA
jgi:hypothetical protein